VPLANPIPNVPQAVACPAKARFPQYTNVVTNNRAKAVLSSTFSKATKFTATHLRHTRLLSIMKDGPSNQTLRPANNPRESWYLEVGFYRSYYDEKR
jgi:hypothetical protein